MSYADLDSPTTLNALAPVAARTVTGVGAAMDVRSQKGIAAVILMAQAGTGTTPTLTVRVQDSDDGSGGWASVPNAVFTQVTTTDSTQKIPLDLDSCRGFIRMSWTIGGTTPSFTFGVAALGRSF
jgi:hypothetical protein